ncbi:Nuclear-interacting partner of ALK [Seminavis robusta]|uniref:Nuclear-interacting partner of ALK n=1 Tax=Seminavis robusta TaxID=568900 RepID=A0A9N8HD79_9STRA|nr:Nuclear-interacting partner of ALK [Seminavis robusta]|eukprot:Sro447_g144850.1 Nuclear-interacting partner of ALK (489) ;mRNA; r:22054-23872
MTAADHDSGKSKEEAPKTNQDVVTKVDLSLLDTWIDDNSKEQDATEKLSFESRLRQLQRNELEKLTSREAFRSRLETFRPLTYFCKPTPLSPLVCARFGWTNTSMDMLRCVCCQAALVVKIHPKITKQSTITKLIQAYQKKLATAHKPTCRFRFEADLHFVVTNNNTTITNNNPEQTSSTTIVPHYMASILPRNVVDMIEEPDSRRLLLTRFNALAKVLHIQDHHSPDDGPPQWQIPELTIPQNVLHFGGTTDDDEADLAIKRRTSLQRRMLAKLAFNRKRPYTALGLEHETLLSRLDVILHPPTKEEEIRAHTRTQSAWESLYEGIAALALFGWIPPPTKSDTTTTVPKEDGIVLLHCPICLSKLRFNLHSVHHHHHSMESAAAEANNDDKEENPTKKQKLETLNPLAAHRHYCPYVCGFPTAEERKGTPIWQTVASKLFSFQDSHEAEDDDETASKDETNNDQSNEATMDRLLGLLQSGVSSRPRK